MGHQGQPLSQRASGAVHLRRPALLLLTAGGNPFELGTADLIDLRPTPQFLILTIRTVSKCEGNRGVEWFRGGAIPRNRSPRMRERGT